MMALVVMMMMMMMVEVIQGVTDCFISSQLGGKPRYGLTGVGRGEANTSTQKKVKVYSSTFKK